MGTGKCGVCAATNGWCPTCAVIGERRSWAEVEVREEPQDAAGKRDYWTRGASTIGSGKPNMRRAKTDQLPTAEDRTFWVRGRGRRSLGLRSSTRGAVEVVVAVEDPKGYPVDVQVVLTPSQVKVVRRLLGSLGRPRRSRL